MNRKWIAVAVLCLCAASFMVGQVVAQDGGDMQMPEWMKTTQEHEDMKKAVGTWEAACKFWMMPGQPPQEFAGEAQSKMIMGGKFLEQVFKSEMMGMPFEGRMIQGFDTVSKEYVSIWIDSMSPYLFIFRGKEKDGVIHLNGREPNHMTGEMRDTRHEIIWTDDNTYVSKMFASGPDGKEMLMGEITYTRAKGE